MVDFDIVKPMGSLDGDIYYGYNLVSYCMIE